MNGMITCKKKWEQVALLLNEAVLKFTDMSSTDLWLKMKRLLLHSLLGIWLWAFLWVGVGFEKTKQIKIYQLSELASVLFIASFITFFPPKIDQTFLNFDLLYTFLRSLQPTSLLFFIMDIIQSYIYWCANSFVFWPPNKRWRLSFFPWITYR